MSVHSRGRPTLLAVAAFLTLIVLASPSRAAAVTIRGNNQAWHPRTVTISEGEKVRWKAVDMTHTVTAWKGDWSKDVTLSAGEKTHKTFNHSGTYRFRCTLHSDIVAGKCEGMCGKVKVT
ncbi:MAG TPA: plastocyanin/azurin family copper-binding protein [Actinomycetota bacterium]|jgi:plastocyanin|nr:plastocyanin/azurin family copper-binding protein [Actinomycetota bacterium]